MQMAAAVFRREGVTGACVRRAGLETRVQKVSDQCNMKGEADHF